jgi:ribosomal protein S26
MRALGRKFNHNVRCDYCKHSVPRGKVVYEFKGEDIKAQGLYHNRQCYEEALKEYEKTQSELGIEDQDINYEE